jgi:hypothetical protein
MFYQFSSVFLDFRVFHWFFCFVFFVMVFEGFVFCGWFSMVFNFFTQQVIYRDNDRSALFVQNFADIQRQEAVTEAYHKLIELGGHPPQYAAFSLPSARPKLSAPRS